MAEPLLQLRAVNKSFGPLHVLRDVDLTLESGEVLVIIGPSGSGKSTVLRCVNGLETVDSGDVTFAGSPVPQAGRALSRLRADIGMVFQQFNLFPHLTVLRNITL